MSNKNRNYSNFSGNSNNEQVNRISYQQPEIEETPVVETDETLVINENPMVENDQETVEETPVVEEIKKLLTGLISGCEKLHVREQSSKESESLAILNKEDEVQIDTDFENEEFYKIKTSSNIDGYCMKKFVTIKI